MSLISIPAVKEIREVNGISSDEKLRILDFLQGAIYCWCKNRPDEWFSLRDLMGGDNYHWDGTPLMALYTKHISLGSTPDEAVDKAGKDGGWLMKRAIENDRRDFETKEEDRIRKYHWLRSSPSL